MFIGFLVFQCPIITLCKKAAHPTRLPVAPGQHFLQLCWGLSSWAKPKDSYKKYYPSPLPKKLLIFIIKNPFFPYSNTFSFPVFMHCVFTSVSISFILSEDEGHCFCACFSVSHHHPTVNYKSAQWTHLQHPQNQIPSKSVVVALARSIKSIGFPIGR